MQLLRGSGQNGPICSACWPKRPLSITTWKPANCMPVLYANPSSGNSRKPRKSPKSGTIPMIVPRCEHCEWAVRKRPRKGQLVGGPMGVWLNATDLPEETVRFYEAYQYFARLVNHPAQQVQLRLRPGTVLFIDNFRVLHGRQAFQVPMFW